MKSARASLFPYLKEARGHGSTWHAIIGWHVAHHWTGSSSCTLKKTKKNKKQSLVSTSTSKGATYSDRAERYRGGKHKTFKAQMDQLALSGEDMVLKSPRYTVR